MEKPPGKAGREIEPLPDTATAAAQGAAGGSLRIPVFLMSKIKFPFVSYLGLRFLPQNTLITWRSRFPPPAILSLRPGPQSPPSWPEPETPAPCPDPCCVSWGKKPLCKLVSTLQSSWEGCIARVAITCVIYVYFNDPCVASLFLFTTFLLSQFTSLALKYFYLKKHLLL